MSRKKDESCADAITGRHRNNVQDTIQFTSDVKQCPA